MRIDDHLPGVVVAVERQQAVGAHAPTRKHQERRQQDIPPRDTAHEYPQIAHEYAAQDDQRERLVSEQPGDFLVQEPVDHRHRRRPTKQKHAGAVGNEKGLRGSWIFVGFLLPTKPGPERWSEEPPGGNQRHSNDEHDHRTQQHVCERRWGIYGDRNPASRDQFLDQSPEDEPYSRPAHQGKANHLRNAPTTAHVNHIGADGQEERQILIQPQPRQVIPRNIGDTRLVGLLRHPIRNVINHTVIERRGAAGYAAPMGGSEIGE